MGLEARQTGHLALIFAPRYGAIAQLGERNAGSVEVGGSIPPGSTKFVFDDAVITVKVLSPLRLEA